jgi:hypothetical protein
VKFDRSKADRLSYNPAFADYVEHKSRKLIEELAVEDLINSGKTPETT